MVYLQRRSCIHKEDSNLDCLRVVAAVLLPPLAVFLTVGLKFHFWLSIVLTLLGYFPGLVHAIWIIVSRSPDKRR